MHYDARANSPPTPTIPGRGACSRSRRPRTFTARVPRASRATSCSGWRRCCFPTLASAEASSSRWKRSWALPAATCTSPHFVGGLRGARRGRAHAAWAGDRGLGRRAVLGSQPYARASRFAIAVGPVSASEYPRYVGRGERVELVREVVEPDGARALDYDVDLLLGDDALAGFPLSAPRGSAGRGYAAARQRQGATHRAAQFRQACLGRGADGTMSESFPQHHEARHAR